jgi:hypothetical protein
MVPATQVAWNTAAIVPTFNPPRAPLFITFRRYRTVPVASRYDGRAFVAADLEPERSATAPSWLKQPRLAKCVMEFLRDGDLSRGLYNLAAFVVMPNHVHLLIDPKASAPKWGTPATG